MYILKNITISTSLVLPIYGHMGNTEMNE